MNRYFGPHDEAQRLPIFPILLDGIEPETLPAFLRLFQVTRWNPAESLPEGLPETIRTRNIMRRGFGRVRRGVLTPGNKSDCLRGRGIRLGRC